MELGQAAMGPAIVHLPQAGLHRKLGCQGSRHSSLWYHRRWSGLEKGLYSRAFPRQAYKQVQLTSTC